MVEILSKDRSRNIALPNFLIVGAAKSGTTSLNYYLKQHPQIYMSPVKEPKFFTAQFLKFPLNGIGDDKVEKRMVKTFDEYKNLFKWVTPERKAIGEASVDNLYYHQKTISYIKHYLDEPKIIILLRNPVFRAFSAYKHLVRDGREFVSFEKGLQLEDERIKNNWEFIWFYKDVGFYYEQVKDYIKEFKRVKIFLTDDLEKNPLKVVKETYEFLEVDPSFVPDVSVKYNVSGVPKSKMFSVTLKKANTLGSVLEPVVNTLFPKKGIKIVSWIEKIRAKNLESPEMKPETKEYLQTLYKENILKLQDLIKRDLSNWLM